MKRQKVKHHPLTRWRFEYGMTVSDVAKALDTTQGYISELENRKKAPSMALAAEIVKMTAGEVQFADLVKN